MISIIVPVYNTQAYLDRCIESMTGQTYGDLEILLIDDCSADGSSAVLERWAAADARIRVIRKETNTGVSDTRNIGLEAAKGDFVTFVDSDDWIDPDHIENLYRVLTETGADMAVSGIRRIKASGVRESLPGIPTGTVCKVDECLLNIMPKRGEGPYNLFLVDKLIRRDKLFRNGEPIRFDPSCTRSEDALWLITVMLTSVERIAYSNTCGYNYDMDREDSNTSLVFTLQGYRHCLSGMRANEAMLAMMREKKSKACNNQLQRVLFYQDLAIRTAKHTGDRDALRTCRKGYVRRLLRWGLKDGTPRGFKWSAQRIATYVLHRGA